MFIKNCFRRIKKNKVQEPEPLKIPKLDPIIFNEHVVDIQKILESKIDKEGKHYTIIDGFTKLDCMAKFPDDKWSYPFIPCVMIVDNETGEMRSFAIGILMPDLKIK